MEFFSTTISPAAIQLATETLHSGWVSEGEKVRHFERTLKEMLGAANPVALNSGTAALHLALAIVGVGSGDEVILPAQTFAATGLAVLMQSATPVFADIDPQTGNISPRSIAEKISDRTRAILPVHWGGYPCDLDEINRLAKEHNVAVIEDAAHALGGSYRGQPIGTISRFTCLSFQAIKHLTTGDGGALCCRDEGDAQAARCRRWFGIDRSQKPSAHGDRVCDIAAVGFKYHMNDLAAAVGLGNLQSFPEQMVRRRVIFGRYREELAGTAGLQLLRLDDDRRHACWLFTMRVQRRNDFIDAMQSRGVPVSVVDLRIDRFTVFGGRRRDLPGLDLFDAEQISLPLHAKLTDDDVQQVISAVRAGW